MTLNFSFGFANFFKTDINSLRYSCTNPALINLYKNYTLITKADRKYKTDLINLQNKYITQLKEKIEGLKNELKAKISSENNYSQIISELTINLNKANADLEKQIGDASSKQSECTKQIAELQSQVDIKKDDHNFCPGFGLATGHMKTLKIPTPCYKDSEEKVWSVIERRKTFTESFNRTWLEYADGFGDKNTDFFIGFNLLHTITSLQPHELLIRLQQTSGTKWARYSHFVVGSESEAFALKSLGAYKGDAGDGLRINEKQKFSTYDRDNDQVESVNCSIDGGGGWWYTDCGLTYVYTFIYL